MSGSFPILCSATAIPDGEGVPEWLHLLPAGEVRTVDGRGPYRVADPAELIRASMAAGKLVLDENHATDLAAPKGGSAPARAWLTELQAREDGIWGKAQWTGEGRRIAEDRQYRGVSPVILHDKSGAISAILRASLTNTPNLAGLAALHSQENDADMDDLRKMLIEALDLGKDADDAAIVAAVRKGLKGDAKALQSALGPIAKAAGLAEDADAGAVLAGVQKIAGTGDSRVTALQTELAGAVGTIKTLQDGVARDKAAAFVDAAIAAGRVGVKPVRDEYIAMHMSDPQRAEKLVNAMPIVAPGPAARAGSGQAAEGAPENPALLAQKAGAYQAKLAATGTTIDFAAAVRAVQEGSDK